MDELTSYLMAVEKILDNKDLTNKEKYLQITTKSLSSGAARRRLYGIRDFIDILKREEPGDIDYHKHIPEDYKKERNLEIRKDGSQVSSRVIPIKVDERMVEAEQKMKDPEFVLEQHGYDPHKWKVSKSRSAIWDAQQKHGRIVVMYSSKLWVKPIENDIAWCELAEYLEDKIKASPNHVPFKHSNIKGNFLAELSMADLHLGKLGWRPESGENFDIKIARDRFKKIVVDQKHRIKDYPIEKILYVLGNDFFHYDNDKQTTQHGTFQHSDVRWAKMFKYGFDLTQWAIEEMSEIAPVECILIPGNHDYQTSYYLAFALSKLYQNNENITIDTKPRRRKYYEYGKNLIGFAHGSELTKKNRLSIMQVEAPKKWGKTKYREFHCGHLHSESSFEHGGIIFRRLSSFTGNDVWHYERGYVGAIKKSQNFIYHKDKGLYEIKHSVIEV